MAELLKSIDLNGDVGEGFPTDREFIPLLTSANIACGAHAGDEKTMSEAVAIAQEHRIGIGAHPGFADRENFGRKEISLATSQITDLVLNQLIRLQKVCDEQQAEIRHLKLHGALYHLAARHQQIAESVVEAIKKFHSPITYIIGQAGTVFEKVVCQAGLVFVAEAFVDRAYDRKGKIIPRSEPGAIISDPQVSKQQAILMVTKQSVEPFGSKIESTERVSLRAQTLCLHGDHAGAVELAHQIRICLQAENVLLKPFGP